MKILLINPPVEDFYFTPQRAYPLGLLYLAAALETAGFTAGVLNCPVESGKTTLKIPQEFRYLVKYYQQNKSPFRLFSNYYYFGLSSEEIRQRIKDFFPDVVGISSNFLPYYDSAGKIAQITKSVDKRIVTVIGGRVPTAIPDFVLKNREIDYLIRGEAEESFRELCAAMQNGKIKKIRGLCYRAKGKLIIDENIALIEKLDTLNFPQRTLIDNSFYKFKGLTSASLISSRGCSLSCGFCAIGEKFRTRSAENVLREIEEMHKTGIRHFDFEDDNINLNPEFEKILDLLIEKFNGKIKISFMNGLLAKGLNKNLQEKLFSAGLTHIDLSIISSDKLLRKEARRKEKPGDIFSLVTQMAGKKMPATVHFIVSLPHQDVKSCLSDLKLLAKERVYLGPSIFYPVIESKFFSALKKEFPITREDYRFFRSSCACFDKSIPRDKIFSVFYFARIINFLKEVIDIFSLNGNGFPDFLKEKTREIKINPHGISSDKKIDRRTLGLILMQKMLTEHTIFRVEEKSSAKSFTYCFFPEKFVNQKLLKSFFEGLKISGVYSDHSIEIKILARATRKRR